MPTPPPEGPMTTARSGAPTRRLLLARALAAPALLGAAGCGFEPMYGGRAAGNPAGPAPAPALAAELAAVRIALVPERTGQLLRRAVQHRLEQSGGTATPRYDLRVALQIGLEAQGFRRDGTPTRQRVTATAPWTLLTAEVPAALVATGAERAFDAFNVPDNQFFAADSSQDAMTRRLIDQVAADIVQNVALALRDRIAPA